mgnify:CR=1 FL=1
MCKTAQKYHSINIVTGQTKYLTGQTFLYLIISYIIPISCPIIRTLNLSSSNFLFFPTDSALRTAPSSMVLGRGYAKRRAVLFCTKSYYPLVGGTSPIPLNKLNAWLRNSYESLISSVGNLFRNEKRRGTCKYETYKFPDRFIE